MTTQKKNRVIKAVEAAPDFPAQERDQLEHWYTDGIVDKYLHKNDNSNKKFYFQDGPITANNPMGVHHAWGRTYKDLWQRYKNMRGYAGRFQNGFDCQGLWVEVEVEKELAFRSKKDIEAYGVDKFVQLCKDRVLKFSAIQTDQSKRLGYFMDWDNSYFTMSEENNYMIWHFLKICAEKGWIYKGHESVPWCPRCETAISQHEMLTEDYKELTHKSIFLELPLVGRDREFLLVWTTTPWTIPANIAVAVDEKKEYSLVAGSTGDKFWVIKDAVDRVFAGDHKGIVKTVLGKELVGEKYKGPFDELPVVAEVAVANPDKFHVVVPTDDMIMPISSEEGTGLVHTAVSAGTEDFQLGKKLSLPMIPIIADNADYLPGLGFLSGQNAKKHPEIILDYLTQKDSEGESWVFKIFNYTHRYPACWRCKTELVWKVTDEWYISMDKKDPDDSAERTLRQKMIDVAKKIDWKPGFGLDRELDWLNNMHDWLISKKNRYWGLALPIWICESCGNFTVIGGKEELKERSVSGWNKFEGHTPHKPFIDEVKIRCACGEEMERTPDVGNPWLDAGIVPFSTLVDPVTKKVSFTSDKKYWSKWFPADFITESFPGQFKNWFYSLIAMSSVLVDSNPFSTVLGFASMLGEDGRAMHKSWGNSIEFNEGADKIGVDVMRWSFVRHNPERNIWFGYKTAADVKRQFHMILWNSYRFFVNFAALEEWSVDATKEYKLSDLDLWILARLNQTVEEVTHGLDSYDAFSAASSVEVFVQDLSNWYIRRSRDRVGPSAIDLDDKDTCYYVLNRVFITLSKILMPFMPFMSDTIFTNLSGEETVHTADWPDSIPVSEEDKNIIALMADVRKICEQGNSIRKAQAIAVKQPLSTITIEISTAESLNRPGVIQLIKDELNVENVVFVNSEDLSVKLDTTLTEDLIQKGRIRETVRSIQEARKIADCRLDEVVDVILPSWPEKYVEEIKRKALVGNITLGNEVKIIRKA